MSMVLSETLASIQAQPMQLRRAAYVSALVRFDWQYRFSDEGARVRCESARFDELRHEAAQIDPSWELWNRHAPAEFADGRKPL